jgi:hypothetical protein
LLVIKLSIAWMKRKFFLQLHAFVSD